MKSLKRPYKYFLNPSDPVEKSRDFRTICELLRELYQRNESPNRTQARNATRELLMEAYDLAKRMDAKLKEYSKTYYHDILERKE